MLAEDFKTLGNTALTAGRYAEAITKFGQAISIDGSNPVYYANRSTAYYRDSQFGKALEDANKSIGLNPGYVKAYGYKGAALEGLGRVKEAMDAYRAGLALDPSNANLKENITRLERDTPSLKSFLLTGPRAALNTAANLLRLFVFLNAILSFIPGFGASSYGVALLGNAATNVIGLYLTHGLPRMTAEFAQAIAKDRRQFVALLSVIFYSVSSPSLIALLTLLAVELFCAAEFVYVLTTMTSPGLASSLASLGSRVLPPAQADSFAGLSFNGKKNAVYRWLIATVCQLEIFLGISLLISMDIMSLIVFGQLMKLRFLLNDDCKAAWSGLRRSCLEYTRHPKCPAIVGVLFDKLAAGLAWFGAPPTPPAPGTAPSMPKCVIM